MYVYYLEHVTSDVDGLCAALSVSMGCVFGDPVAELGSARVADRPDGSKWGVRAPMHGDEAPATRPYFLVEDIQKATKDAEANGAIVAHPPMEISGRGRFSILFLGDLQFGFWQL